MNADSAAVLVIGCRGQIGRELVEAQPCKGLAPIGLSHDDLDVTDRDDDFTAVVSEGAGVRSIRESLAMTDTRKRIEGSLVHAVVTPGVEKRQ